MVWVPNTGDLKTLKSDGLVLDCMFSNLNVKLDETSSRSKRSPSLYQEPSYKISLQREIPPTVYIPLFNYFFYFSFFVVAGTQVLYKRRVIHTSARIEISARLSYKHTNEDVFDNFRTLSKFFRRFSKS